MRKLVSRVLVVASLLGLACTTSAAIYHPYMLNGLPYTIQGMKDEYPGLTDGFDDLQLYDIIKRNTANFFESAYDLQKGWTGDQYATKFGAEEFERVRTQFEVPAQFTRDDMVATEVNSQFRLFIEEHSLPEHFSEAELVRSEGMRRALKEGYISSDREPISHEVARLIAAFGKSALDKIRIQFDDTDNTGEFDDARLRSHFQVAALRYIEVRFHSLRGNFTSKMLLDYLIKQADDRMRERFAFTASYNEDDVTNATARDILSRLRVQYKLPLHFTEKQLSDAMEIVRRENHL
jgi:hypothetical protein